MWCGPLSARPEPAGQGAGVAAPAGLHCAAGCGGGGVDQGGGCALPGLLGSGLTDLPSGPCVVVVQLLGFLVALAAHRT